MITELQLSIENFFLLETSNVLDSVEKERLIRDERNCVSFEAKSDNFHRAYSKRVINESESRIYLLIEPRLIGVFVYFEPNSSDIEKSVCSRSEFEASERSPNKKLYALSTNKIQIFPKKKDVRLKNIQNKQNNKCSKIKKIHTIEQKQHQLAEILHIDYNN